MKIEEIYLVPTLDSIFQRPFNIHFNLFRKKSPNVSISLSYLESLLKSDILWVTLYIKLRVGSPYRCETPGSYISCLTL